MSKIEELAARFRRPASVMIVDGTPPPDDPFASKFGCVTSACAGEEWPMLNGSPMIALCQLNVSGVPHHPDVLEGIRLLTVFVSNRAWDKFCPSNAQNGDGWVIRTYGLEDELVAVEPPVIEECRVSWWKRLGKGKAFQLTSSAIEWKLQNDLPDLELVDSLCPEIRPLWNEHEEEIETVFENVDASKVGGWPSLVQGAVFHGVDPSPQYAFQIASHPELGLVWGDLGIATFGLRKSDVVVDWFLDTNFT